MQHGHSCIYPQSIQLHFTRNGKISSHEYFKSLSIKKECEAKILNKDWGLDLLGM